MEYKLVSQVHDVLHDFIEMVTEEADDEDEDDEASALETRIAHISRRIRASRARSTRVRKIITEWERFASSLENDYEKTIEPLSDKFDTLLLDNELRLQQLEEKKRLLEY